VCVLFCYRQYPTHRMPSHARYSGLCGHGKIRLDNHERCLTCCGCSRSVPCSVSKEWKGSTWETVEKKRSSAKGKKKAVSRQVASMFSSDSSESEDLSGFPPVEVHGVSDSRLSEPRATSRSPSRSGSTLTSGRDVVNLPIVSVSSPPRSGSCLATGRGRKSSSSSSSNLSEGGDLDHPHKERKGLEDEGSASQIASAAGRRPSVHSIPGLARQVLISLYPWVLQRSRFTPET
jgi:hypothetical protein